MLRQGWSRRQRPSEANARGLRSGLIIPHRRDLSRAELPRGKGRHNSSHRKVRALFERAFVRMKSWKILRDWRKHDRDQLRDNTWRLGCPRSVSASWSRCSPGGRTSLSPRREGRSSLGEVMQGSMRTRRQETHVSDAWAWMGG
jgi:hypothetical protein